jgi:hypothetical protein
VVFKLNKAGQATVPYRFKGHWNGAKWTVMPGPNPSNEFNQLNGITNISGSLWSVGDFGTSNFSDTLVELFCQ